jgi:hypothetical protein
MEKTEMKLTLPARLFLAVVILSGFALLGKALLQTNSIDYLRFVAFLLVACLAARLKVKLPGVNGTMSVNLPFILVAVAQMSAVEALTIAFVSTFVQCLPRGGHQFNLVQSLFNCSTMVLAVGAARLLYSSHLLGTAVSSRSLLVAVAAAGYLLANTVPVAVIISLVESKNVLRTWIGIFQLSFPYFVASAGIAGVVLTLSAGIGWQVPLAVLPIMLGIFHSYQHYFSAASLQTRIEAGASKAAASVA